MNKEPMPPAEQDLLSPLSGHAPAPRRKPIVLLLGISTALVLGVCTLLLNKPIPSPQPQAMQDNAPRKAPTIAGKSEIQLKAELVRVNQELEQAKAEREEMLKAIDKMSVELSQKLKEASITNEDLE